MRWFFGLFVVLLIGGSVAAAANYYPQVRALLPELPLTHYAHVETSLEHELPNGKRIRIYRFQNSIQKYSTGVIRTYDVEVAPIDPVDDVEVFTDEVFDDLMSVEADARELNSATVTIRARQGSSDPPVTNLFVRDSEFVWQRDGHAAPHDDTRAFNLKSPKSVLVNATDSVEIEGERIRHHVRAGGALMFEAALYWPEENWNSVPWAKRRQKGHELARDYWLERGKTIADQRGAQMALIRLYTTPFEIRARGRQHLWTGVVKQAFGWEEIALDVEQAQKKQGRLMIPEPVDANWLKLPDGEAVQVEGVAEKGFASGTYRLGLVLSYRSDLPLDDGIRLDNNAQLIFDNYLKNDCAKARVKTCAIEAKHRVGLFGIGWDDTHDALFEFDDGDWRPAKKK